MIPYTYAEWRLRLLIYGTVFTLTRNNKDGTTTTFLLDLEEVQLKELQNDKPKL